MPEEAFKPKDKKKAKLWKGPSPMRLITEPYKPKRSLFKGEPPKVIPPLWDAFVSEMYWSVTLQNDEDE